MIRPQSCFSKSPKCGKSSVLSGRGSHARYAPGAPGCLPGFRLFPPPRALRCGGFFPGRSSDEGGIEEFPLLRDSARSSRLTCSRSAAIWSACALTASRSSPISSCCAAICSSRAAQAAQSGAGGGRADTGHDHQEPAGSKQADTPSRPAEAGQTISSAASHLNIRRRHGGLNVYIERWVANYSNMARELFGFDDLQSIRCRGVVVEYMVKDNEGHGFHNEENRFDFYGAMEKFLDQHLHPETAPAADASGAGSN